MSSRVTEAEFSLATEMIQNRELSSELKKAKDDAEVNKSKTGESKDLRPSSFTKKNMNE